MPDLSTINYAALDRPEVLSSLFHPRREWQGAQVATYAQDISIPVEKDVVIGARFHMVESSSPNILFFHGNGEIVADYDDLGPVYNRMGINFLPVDYRGYGKSTGSPTVTSMMKDCHAILEFTRKWLANNGYDGPVVVMGRSLGSASVIELASTHQEQIAGLIVESGFAYAEPLLRLLGIDARSLGFREEQGFRNVDKIRLFQKPTLIIHAEFDHIIPFSDGMALFEACGATQKKLVKIPGANHNDIFARGLTQYMSAVKDFMELIRVED